MGAIPNRQDFMRRLMQSGAYTEMQASVLADALDATFEQPASKLDLMEARAEARKDSTDLRLEVKKDMTDLREEFADVRLELKTEINELRQEMGVFRGDLRVLGERVERIADRTLIRLSVVMVVLLTAAFGASFRIAMSVWPPT